MVFHAGARLGETYPGRNAVYIYNKLSKHSNNPINIKAGGCLSGKTFSSFSKWYNYKHKDDVLMQVRTFKDYLRTISDNYGDFIGIPDDFFDINTPILRVYEQSLDPQNINSFVKEFEKAITTGSESSLAPNILINTELGLSILHDLKNTSFSNPVFSHCYLNYKSVVLKHDKLIGITDWQYAGYYPPEFEDIIEKYMEHFI